MFQAAVVDAAEDVSPLNQRDIIPIQRADVLPENLVSMRYITRTGEIPASPGWGNASNGKNLYTINFQKDDAFNRALKTIKSQALIRFEHKRVWNRHLDSVMKKSFWSKADLQTYEAAAADSVAEAFDRMPGFGDYRTNIKNGLIDLNDRIRNIESINDVSVDIEHNTETMRLDCGIESAIKGLALQDMMDKQLPTTAGANNYKKAGAYYYVVGNVTFRSLEDPVAHIFLFTPAGNIIEATGDPSSGFRSYVRTTNGNTLQQFVQGRPVVWDNRRVYDVQARPTGFHDRARAESKLEREGKLENGQTRYDASYLIALAWKQGDQILDAQGYGLIARDHIDPDGKHSFSIFQKQNTGTPDEGFYLAASGSAEPHFADSHVVNYRDALTNQYYAFQFEPESSGGTLALLTQQNYVFKPVAETQPALTRAASGANMRLGGAWLKPSGPG